MSRCWASTAEHERNQIDRTSTPTVGEQQRIVEEVERRLSVIEELDAAIIGNFKRAERPRQSIVHRTFAGAMPPQPN
jgi:hypothetical protein